MYSKTLRGKYTCMRRGYLVGSRKTVIIGAVRKHSFMGSLKHVTCALNRLSYGYSGIWDGSRNKKIFMNHKTRYIPTLQALIKYIGVECVVLKGGCETHWFHPTTIILRTIEVMILPKIIHGVVWDQQQLSIDSFINIVQHLTAYTKFERVIKLSVNGKFKFYTHTFMVFDLEQFTEV